jgi:hypothetical protein
MNGGLRFANPPYALHYIMPDSPENPSPTSRDERVELHALVGLGISSWTFLESFLIFIVATLLSSRPEQAGAILYSITNFPTWLNIIDELFTIDDRFSHLKPKWDRLNSTLRGLNDVRVRLAHNTSVDLGTDFADSPNNLRPPVYDVRIKSKRHAALTSEEISAFIQRVAAMTRELIKFTGELQQIAIDTSSENSRA